jgi:hypothetical protein
MAGIGSFTKHAKQNSFGGQWLNDWKDDKKIVIWLHTLVPPAACWSHAFQLLDVVEDKENGGAPKRIMRYPRFVSPDPELVHRNQYFRKDDDAMRVPPDRDPFLLLREWLRRADSIALDQAVFQWKNPKDNEVTTWVRGELSGLVKRARSNFGHSLDTKQEYIFAVVRNDAPEQGVFLARESQLLGRKVSEVITQQQGMLGEEGGDPLLHPYPFVWEANKKAASPMDMYKAYKHEGAECSDEVWAAISSEEYPDPAEFCVARDGDMEKVRAAMEAAAQVDLPLDEIFSEEPGVRLALALGQRRAARGPARMPAAAGSQPAPGGLPATQQRPAQSSAAPAAQRPAGAQRPGAQRPASTAAAPSTARPGASPKPATTAAAAPPAKAAAGQPRRKKVEKPKEPEVEKIPCDDCQHPMLPTETVCTKCGAVYETEAVAVAGGEPAADPAVEEQAGPVVCFACGCEVDANNKCMSTSCGIDQGDDIPF